MKDIRIKYFNEDYPKIKRIKKGNWIDLYVDRVKQINNIEEGEAGYYTDQLKNKGMKYEKGDVITFKLGVAMELPEGYEALVAPRSSIFKHYGFIQTNSLGIIDTVYNGDKDEWLIQVLAIRSGVIKRHERICQFRIIESQEEINFIEVDSLDNAGRGGWGTTGTGIL